MSHLASICSHCIYVKLDFWRLYNRFFTHKLIHTYFWSFVSHFIISDSVAKSLSIL